MPYAPNRKALHVLSNPPNPWHSSSIDWLGEPPKTELEVYEDATKSILSKNDSPDVCFTYSVNPYRGCYHGCAYCYARPSHQYLDFGAGTDFERKLTVKPDAAALLREAFERKSWRGDLIVFSGNTDCYQPLEASWKLTRACLEVCLEYRNPVGLITKSTLIERDIDLLQALTKEARCSVTVSVPFWDRDNARAIEPYVPTPERRIQTIAKLAGAGIPVSVNVAPIIPGLNDSDAPEILRRAKEAGATGYATILVRLPGPVNEVFEERLRALLPLKAEKVLHAIEACRGGKRSDPRFGSRMHGTGARWDVIERMIETHAEKLGFHPGGKNTDQPTTFRRPEKPKIQGELFATFR